MPENNNKAPNVEILVHGDLLVILEQEFDSDFYLERYPDVRESGIDPLEHYAFAGWLLGRDPCNAFSTSYYLSRYEDVEDARFNPFYHYLKFGRLEGRWPMQPTAGNIELDRLAAILRGFFDADFYLQQYPDIEKAELDPLEHYIRAGFREGRIPFPGFNPDAYRAANGLSDDDSPLYHYAIYGRFQNEREAKREKSAAGTKNKDIQNAERIIEAITAEFDTEYYLNTYQDVAIAGMDPVRHYHEHGWKEGRNPHPQFNTQYYLDANPDVKTAGINPFWHYITKGRAENRKALPAGGYKWVTLRALKSIDERVEKAPRWGSGEIKTQEQILDDLDEAMIGGSRVFVVSVSHDDYTRETGGVQLCIAEEQVLLNEGLINYLNIYPVSPLPVLSNETTESLAVTLILNGRPLGSTSLDVLLKALALLAEQHDWKKYLVVHALHGHTVEGVIALNKVLSPDASYYWLHDYFSICPGYNLLRNDVDYCHSPDSNSPACGICVYGEIRGRHLYDHDRLFREAEFDVISPSRFALDLWEEKSSLPCGKIRVIPHRDLKPVESGAPVEAEHPGHSLKVAYLGYPIPHKGWPVFESLAVTFGSDERYDFYHMGIGRQYNSNIIYVEARTNRENLDLMTDRVRENGINVVVLPAIWPETFSLTAYEAIAAGCYVLASANSGNIAALVRERGCGMIYEDEDALHAWFADGSVVDKARKYQSESPCFRLARSGITAPLILEASGI